MDIYLEDLGRKSSARVLQIRLALSGLVPPTKMAGVVSGLEPMALPPMPLSSVALARLSVPSACVGGLTGAGLAIMGGLFAPSFGLSPSDTSPIIHVYVTFGLGGGLGGGALGFLTGFGRRSLVYRRELRPAELNVLARDNGDTLSHTYVTVTRMMMAMPVPGDAAAERNIRNTLRRLGEAIENLPPEPAADVLTDPTALQAEGTQLAAKAQAEPDPVVAASWERQAEALARRAATITRTAALVRRHQILREEVAAQLQTFQASLAAASIHGNMEIGGFEALAESVAQVAREADALADARAEFDAALAPPLSMPEQPVRLRGT